MKITQILSVSLLFLFSINGFSQEKSCNVKQLQLNTYDFAIKNLDSIKKYSAAKDKITAALEFTAKGALTKSDFYATYGAKEQKQIKVWKGLEKHIKETFSLCPDSHFYNDSLQVVKSVFEIPFTKEALAKAKKDIETSEGYTALGTGKKEIPLDSKYVLDVKSFTVGKKVMEPFKKEGVMDYNTSTLIKMSDIFYIAFDIVREDKTNYLKYFLYERVDHKGRMITTENWRPIVNGKVHIFVKGIRDDHPGVRHIIQGEEFNVDFDITFK